MILQINKQLLLESVIEEASHDGKGHEHLSKTKLRLGDAATSRTIQNNRDKQAAFLMKKRTAANEAKKIKPKLSFTEKTGMYLRNGKDAKQKIKNMETERTINRQKATRYKNEARVASNLGTTEQSQINKHVKNLDSKAQSAFVMKPHSTPLNNYTTSDKAPSTTSNVFKNTAAVNTNVNKARKAYRKRKEEEEPQPQGFRFW